MEITCTQPVLEQPEKKRAVLPTTLPHLFVLYDTGETEFLAPVIQRLESEGKDYRILVMGIAKEIIKRKNLPETKILTLDSLGIDKNVDKKWPREQGLTEAEIGLIHSQISLSNLVVGFASSIQAQLLKEYAQEAHTFTVWDNFAPAFSAAPLEIAKSVLHAAHKVLYPSNYVVNNMTEGPENYAVVGQPFLETFCIEYAKIDAASIREKLGLDPKQKVTAYLGGYSDDQDYREGFELFAKCLAHSSYSDTLFVVQPHPKSGEGSFEREIMEKYGVTNYLVPPEKTVNSQQVVAISSGPVICHKSSVGVKVAALGKEIIHLLPEGDAWTNALIDAKVSPKISSSGAFEEAFLSSRESEDHQDIYSIMMMPKNATDLVYSEILASDNSDHKLSPLSLFQSEVLERDKTAKRHYPEITSSRRNSWRSLFQAS